MTDSKLWQITQDTDIKTGAFGLLWQQTISSDNRKEVPSRMGEDLKLFVPPAGTLCR